MKNPYKVGDRVIWTKACVRQAAVLAVGLGAVGSSGSACGG
jgi:hypothetical protein